MENGKYHGIMQENDRHTNDALMEVFGNEPSVVSEYPAVTTEFVLEEGEPMQLLTDYLQDH